MRCRWSQYFFWTQSFLKTIEHCRICDARFIYPVLQALCSSVMRQPNVPGRIPCLVMLGCPSTILRSIRTVIVNTVNTCSWWAWSHISEKLCKALYPLRCYSNPTSSVEMICVRVRIQTSAFNVSPGDVFRRVVFMRRSAMLCKAEGKDFSRSTATAHGLLSAQVDTTQRPHVPTEAPTHPIGVAWLRRITRQHCPVTTNFACHINSGFSCATSTAFTVTTAQLCRLDDALGAARTATQHIGISSPLRIGAKHSPITKSLPCEIKSNRVQIVCGH
jgi:hypothetical protein